MKPAQTAQQSFETTSLTLASFLRCRDFPIENIKRHNGRTTFVFHDSPGLRESVIEYTNDAPIAVRTFYNTLRDLKGITR
jgi:hypothetical protein